MDDQDVEPGIPLLTWPLELDLFLLERQVQSLVPHMPDSIQSYFGIALLEEDGLDLDLLNISDLSEIVDIVIVFLLSIQPCTSIRV